MLAVLLAVSAVGGGVSVTANADELVPMQEEITSLTSYDLCDIDRDGDVDIIDVLKLEQYLVGVYYVPDYDRLDANQNQIIDSTDAEYILNRLVGVKLGQKFVSRTYLNNTLTESTVNFSKGSNTVLDPDASSVSSRTYIKHKYSNGQNTSYTLTPSSTPMSTNQEYSINKIVDGSDNRYSTTLPENTGIVRLACPFGSGTGFIVGDHVIATAAHCVYDVSSQQFYPNMKVQAYSANGTLTGNTFNAVETHIPNDYTIDYDNNFTNSTAKIRQIDYDRSIYDYALITVSDDLSSYPHFTIGTTYNLSPSGWANTPLFVTGCPGSIGGVENSSYKLYSQMGNVMQPTGIFDYHTDRLLYHNVDTSGGQSGSPVYTITKYTQNGNDYYTYTAVSLVHGGTDISVLGSNLHNLGTRFTKYHQDFYGRDFYANSNSNQETE